MPRLDLLTANDRPGAYPESWYAATTPLLPPFPALAGAVEADVCVVGGGYTGLSAALHLAECGFDVALVEASRVGSGASGRNGGQVHSGQRQDQDWLEGRLGPAAARTLWDLAEEAKALVRGLVARHGIDCDLRDGIVAAAHRAAYVPAYHAEAAKLAQVYGYDRVEPLDAAGIRDLLGTAAYHGGSLDRGAAHLHPLAYAIGLARAADAAGVRIFETSRVTAIGAGARPEVRTADGAVRARFVVLAANGYVGHLVPAVSARVMPINNFIVATAPLERMPLAEPVAVADSRFVVTYYRPSADGRLLFGGGESYGWRFPADIRALVRPRLAAIYPDLADVALDYAWGGTLAITVNRMPAFQRLAPNVLSASGYSGHGVAMATLAGKLLAEAVAGTAERFDVFARIPQPAFPGGAAMRWPLLVLAMTWYALRDRL
ncbi:MAG: FAD-binding oxidoreductase [Amaricoccus sp.]|uniref:NAD(P)/FAD-dependent oxidoreductase n=1 Tax=Amaricoccus sp. TaxID=1872485 RepID=UPI0039E357CF